MGKRLSQRWEQARAHYTLLDVTFDALGKILFGVGLGLFLGDTYRMYAWCFIGSGLIAAAIVKSKLIKYFLE